jgi:CRP-like cAMP-binding protein
MERVVLLKNTLLLAHLPFHILTDIAETMKVIFFRKGEAIITAGQPGNIPLYLLVSGKAKHLHPYTYEQDIFRKGDLIGENFILDTDICPWDIVAQEDAWAYAIEKESIYKLISYYPETGYLYAQLASKLTPSEELTKKELEYTNT